MHHDDIALVEAAKRDPKKFEALYNKYAEKVFNFFWYRTRHDRDISEDLTQETFVRAFENLDKFRYRGYPYLTYLLTIARRILIDHTRKPKTVRLDDVGEVPYEIIEDLERASDARALWHAIQELPGSNRDALLMHYQQEMPVKDIARVMNTSENAVKLNLSRTRKKLARHPRLQDVRKFADTKKSYTKPRFLANKK